jgi:hypothetical protein
VNGSVRSAERTSIGFPAERTRFELVVPLTAHTLSPFS